MTTADEHRQHAEATRPLEPGEPRTLEDLAGYLEEGAREHDDGGAVDLPGRARHAACALRDIARDTMPEPMHLRIIQGHNLIADLPGWPHPIPRVGDYIFHPPSGDTNPEGIAGSVKSVTWRTHDRAEDRFVTTARPYVELAI